MEGSSRVYSTYLSTEMLEELSGLNLSGLKLPKVARRKGEKAVVACFTSLGVLEDWRVEAVRAVCYESIADPALDAAERLLEGRLEAGEEEARELLEYLEELMGRFGWEPVFIAYGYRLRCRLALLGLREGAEAYRRAWRSVARWRVYREPPPKWLMEEVRLKELVRSMRKLPAPARLQASLCA